ncbi:MAG: PAS domain S-box protein [Cyanobacteriota bacterium]
MVQPPDGGLAKFSFMSERFLQICGLIREQAAADPMRAFACVHPDDYDDWLQLNIEAFQHRQPFYGECRVVADGIVRWISAESVPRPLPDGSTVWEGVLIDITKQRQTLAALASSEEHFRLLAENSSDVVFRLADDGRVLWVSPSLTPALGWHPDEWIGQRGIEFLVHRGEADHYRTNLQTLHSGAGATLARDQIRAKDGSIHWIETHAGPYRNARGEVDGIVASFRVVDQQVAAEQDLMISEERYRLLAENARDVIRTMEVDSRFSYNSPSMLQLRKFRPEEAIVQPIEQIHPPDSLR